MNTPSVHCLRAEQVLRNLGEARFALCLTEAADLVSSSTASSSDTFGSKCCSIVERNRVKCVTFRHSSFWFLTVRQSRRNEDWLDETNTSRGLNFQVVIASWDLPKIRLNLNQCFAFEQMRLGRLRPECAVSRGHP